MPSAVRRGNRREIEGKRKKTEGAGKEQPPEDGPLKKGSCFFWREFFFIVEAGDLVRPFLFRAACLLEMDAGGASPPLEQPAGAASGFLCGGVRPGAAWVVDVRRPAASAVRLDFAAILRSAEGSALPAEAFPVLLCTGVFSASESVRPGFFRALLLNVPPAAGEGSGWHVSGMPASASLMQAGRHGGNKTRTYYILSK